MGRNYTIMFTDNMSKIRWIVLLDTKYKVVETLYEIVEEVGDPESSCVDRWRYDGASQCKGYFVDLDKSVGIGIQTNAPHEPQGKSKLKKDLVQQLIRQEPHNGSTSLAWPMTAGSCEGSSVLL